MKIFIGDQYYKVLTEDDLAVFFPKIISVLV